MANVLIVSYLFPPCGGVGVLRPVAYARHLPELGCPASVVTVRWPRTAYKDPELEARVPSSTRVYRVANPELPYGLKNGVWSRLSGRGPAAGRSAGGGARRRLAALARRAAYTVFFPDVQSTCVPFAVAKASRLIRTQGIDTVLVIAPPFSLLKIGLALKRRHPGLRLITDLRDDWLGYYISHADGPSDYAIAWPPRQLARARALERSAFTASDFVSIATPAWVEVLRKRYPDLPPQRFFCTTNGFDPNDVPAAAGLREAVPSVRVMYFGSMNLSRVYSPQTYLDAMAGLPEGVRNAFKTTIVGRVTAECQHLLAGHANVAVRGPAPKGEGLRWLREADLLLLIATGRDSQTGKLFDYLAIGKPILALTPPDGQIAAVLRETGAGWAVDPFDSGALRERLLWCYRRLRAGERLTSPDARAIGRYAWPEVVAGFARRTGLLAPQAAPQTAVAQQTPRHR